MALERGAQPRLRLHFLKAELRLVMNAMRDGKQFLRHGIDCGNHIALGLSDIHVHLS